jgi:uncharacterized protein YecT (DUF1311 family)
MRILVLLGFLLATSEAFAIDCDHAVTTLDINECAWGEQKKVETKLNQVYQRVLKGLDQPDTEMEHFSHMKESLLQAQRAWITFREANCRAAYDRNASGTMRTVIYIGCMQTHAEQRIKELEEYERE